MKVLYRWVRAIVVTLILIAVGVPVILYISLSIPGVQRKIRDTAQKELSVLLNSHVAINDMAITPFNRITLYDVSLTDAMGDKALHISRLGAGISLVDLIFFGDFVVNYVEIIGLEGNLYKENPHSVLNIDNIIEALKPKDKESPEVAFKLSINNILLRNIDFSYNVLSEPVSSPDRFNRNHIHIRNLRGDIAIPVLSNDVYAADVYRLALEEQSGFSITNFHGRLFLSSDSVTVSDLSVSLPESRLNFSDVRLIFPDKRDLKSILDQNHLSFSILKDSYVTPSDLRAFFQPLRNVVEPVDINMNLSGNISKISLAPLSIKSRSGEPIDIRITGEAYNILDFSDRRIDFKTIDVISTGRRVASLLPATVNQKARYVITDIGLFDYSGTVDLSESYLSAKGELTTEAGSMEMSIDADRVLSDTTRLTADYKLEAVLHDINLQRLLHHKESFKLSAEINSEGRINGPGGFVSENNILISHLLYKGYNYSDIDISIATEPEKISGSIISENDDNCDLSIEGSYSFPRNDDKSVEVNANITGFNPYNLNLWDKFEGMALSGTVSALLSGHDIDDINGFVKINDVEVIESDKRVPLVSYMNLNIDGEPGERTVSLESNIIDFKAEGSIYAGKIPGDVKTIAENLFPALFESGGAINAGSGLNDFRFTSTIHPTEFLTRYVNLPFSAMDDVVIRGDFNSAQNSLNVEIDAPYLRQGNKLIENSRLNLSALPGAQGSLALSTFIPTKDGLMNLSLNNDFSVDAVLSHIQWKIDRDKDFSGNLSIATSFQRKDAVTRDDDMKFTTAIRIDPGTMVFNDSVWNIDRSSIHILDRNFIKIDSIGAHRYGQDLTIAGVVSTEPYDILTVNLDNINLDYIFETLDIDNVTIGGDATGTFRGSALLSGEPQLLTDNLQVDGISYNSCVFGDAVINSKWDVEKRAIALSADISQQNGRHSFITGEILPLNDSLDLRFNVDKLRVGFLRPYMKAFSSDVSGYVSGNARLWGNFKYIDLEGRLEADSIRMKIDFTNTYYTASDSVIINPGSINLDNLSLTDDYGNRARLNGRLTHTFFKQPHFDFNITDAVQLLVFDEPEYRNPRWYGRVFANGGASVKGGPGYVDIGCNMATAAGTVFSFVLTDMEEAGEYTFITYRDRDIISMGDSLVLLDPTPELVRSFKERLKESVDDDLSTYSLEFNLDVNPDAQLNLVMDPVGGDRIRAYGEGNMRISYGSTDEELRIYGTYTLVRGNYNFTLQDIIIKDFTIREGSSITFRGDPYTAVLNITAVYALTANLSDLDAMFLEDRDISRTNVPVHALLHVAGDLHQPDISFDLEFPTLTQDTYRKVKSIVSTDDMMNRQIIYLLALNRFYTPDYMQSATKGNELISVASSTLSSQLSNILGQISDKWTIAPSIKSERSDFSDMEVDLALSSALLNNRLLLNGNFGYRDKQMNTNQFIGDFDIEYLLNRKGTVRLKAYNRYNDRNFYFKTANTTQGVGVVFKHDFDNFNSFLKLFQKEKSQKVEKNEE